WSDHQARVGPGRAAAQLELDGHAVRDIEFAALDRVALARRQRLDLAAASLARALVADRAQLAALVEQLPGDQRHAARVDGRGIERLGELDDQLEAHRDFDAAWAGQ